jgi:protein TonB
MIGIGVIVTLAFLPIMAKLGLLKAIQEKYVETTMIPMPPIPPQPKEAKAKAKKAVHHAEARHGAQIASGAHSAPLPVHVAMGNGAGGDNSVGQNGSVSRTGLVPLFNPNAGSGSGQGGPVTPPATPPPPPVVTPPPTVVTPTPPTPKEDVIVEAEPSFKPEPVIPDDLLDSDIDTTFYAYFTISQDGTTDVKMVQGTGNSILDRLAMDAAKQWKFTPATKNGVPVLSYRQLQVEFVVS